MEDDSVEAGQYCHVVIMIFTSHRSTFNCILKLKDELSICKLRGQRLEAGFKRSEVIAEDEDQD